MQEELNSKISELVDHELPVEDAIDLLEEFNNCPSLEEKMHRYQAISHVLKTDAFIVSDADFISRVKNELVDEPVFLIPGKRSKTKNYQIFSAMAASLAVMSIIIYGGMESKPITDKLPVLQMVSDNTLPINKPQPDTKRPGNNKRFNNYIEAHRGSLYTAGSPAYQSYVQLADYGQE